MSKAKVTNPLDDWMGYQLQRAATVTKTELTDRLKEIDLRIVDASVLLLIGSNPDIIASRIGRILDIKTANMVPIMRLLEDRKLVDRNPIDGKSHGLSLTSEGTRTAKAARAIMQCFENDLENQIPSNQCADLSSALEAIWKETSAVRKR